MNRPDHAASPAGADPSKMSDDQIRAYLAAHPELLNQVAAGADGGAGPEQVAVEVQGQDWAAGAGKKSGGSGGGSGGGMFGGMFGSRSAKASSAPVAAPFTGQAKADDGYVPPVIPAAAPASAPASAEYAPPPAPGPAPAGSFAIGEDDDNPFAATGAANPYGTH